MRAAHLILDDLRTHLIRTAGIAPPSVVFESLINYIKDEIDPELISSPPADETVLKMAADIWGLDVVSENPTLTVGDLKIKLHKYELAQVLMGIDWAKVDWNMLAKESAKKGT